MLAQIVLLFEEHNDRWHAALLAVPMPGLADVADKATMVMRGSSSRSEVPKVAALKTGALSLLLFWGCCLFASSALGQPNSWRVLSPTPSAHWEPANFTDCTRVVTMSNPPGRSYSGSASGNGRIYYWGGGHNSYPGNDIVIYDIAQNRWIPDPVPPDCLNPVCESSGNNNSDSFPVNCTSPSSVWDPTCLPGSCYIRGGNGSYKPVFRCAGGSRVNLVCAQDSECPGGGTCSIGIPSLPNWSAPCTTCKPYTEHIYQRIAYNPQRNALMVVTFSGTFEYNLTTQSWSGLAKPPPHSADQSQRMVMWDPPRQRMLYFQLGGFNTGVYAFNYANNSWSTVHNQSAVPSAVLGEPSGSWDARGGAFIIASANGSAWYKYDPTVSGISAWTNITAGAPSDVKQAYCAAGNNVFPCFSASLTYDASIQRTVVLTLNANAAMDVWVYDALGDSWTKMATSGASAGTNTSSGYPNNLHYDPGTSSLYLVDQAGIWSWGPAGRVQVKVIRLDTGNPLPTNTPANTATRTSTPALTSTGALATPTRTATQAASTPTQVSASTPTAPVGPGTPTPTCAGTVRQVGPGRTYTRVSQAAAAVQSNDCIYIDPGTYVNDAALARWPSGASNVTIRGAGGMAHMTITNGDLVTGMGADGSKGIWVVNGNNTTIENIRFSCATSRTNNVNCAGPVVGDWNNAGIRLQAPGTTVRNCIFHDNDNGILGGPTGGSPVGTVTIEQSEFFRNGFGDGQSHNVYLNQYHDTLVFRGNYSHGAIVGHNLKSRAPKNYILYNRFMDEQWGAETMVGGPYCTDPGTCAASVQVEVPWGGLTYVIGNVIQKGPYADAGELVKYAAEGGVHPIQELYVINNTMVNERGSGFFIRGSGTAPLLWAKNNVFWGAGTPINWPAGGAQVTASNVTSNPQLLSQNTRDYRLTASSTAVVNQGVDPGSDSRGFSLTPTQYYVYDRLLAVRPVNGALDVGAFEYIAGAAPFPTPTNTPTNTATLTPVPTATPAAPVFCPAGQKEAVYPIALVTDDGIVGHAGSAYPPMGTAYQEASGYANYWASAVRKNSGSAPYKTELILWRWNTSRLPDGSAWPAGTQITGALVRPYWNGAGSGSRSLVWEWHNWATISDANWTNTSVTSSDPNFAATSAVPTSGGRQTIALSNATAKVTLSGHTGIRLTFVDGTAPVPNEENLATVQPRDLVSIQGEQSTQLVVCYMTGPTPTPRPPSAPTLL
jgi:hypothetical protein